MNKWMRVRDLVVCSNRDDDTIIENELDLEWIGGFCCSVFCCLFTTINDLIQIFAYSSNINNFHIINVNDLHKI